MMKKTSNQICWIFLGLISLLVGMARAQEGPSVCQDLLPEKFRSEIRERFPGSKIEEPSDLSTEYREMWMKVHALECPGITLGKYRGGDRTLFAVLILSTDHDKPGAKLLLVDPAASGSSQFLVLETIKIATSSPDIIYTLPPGVYSEPQSAQKTRIPYGGVALEQLEVGSILYYYRAGTLHKLTLSE